MERIGEVSAGGTRSQPARDEASAECIARAGGVGCCDVRRRDIEGERLGSDDASVNTGASRSSLDHGDRGIVEDAFRRRSTEERLGFTTTIPGETLDQLIRADMTYIEKPAGGAVFSVGSITYCGSLPSNQFDNDVSRLTFNVVNKFGELGLKWPF